MYTHALLYLQVEIYKEELNAMVIIIRNEIGNPSSKPEQGCLHFILC